MNDIYSIHCGLCEKNMGVCPGSQPMPSIYCTDCEPVIRDAMMLDNQSTICDSSNRNDR